jgi:hypothetical protein
VFSLFTLYIEARLLPNEVPLQSDGRRRVKGPAGVLSSTFVWFCLLLIATSEPLCSSHMAASWRMCTVCFQRLYLKVPALDSREQANHRCSMPLLDGSGPSEYLW